jgi:hypothetical protein
MNEAVTFIVSIYYSNLKGNKIKNINIILSEAMQHGGYEPTFQKNLLHPPSG